MKIIGNTSSDPLFASVEPGQLSSKLDAAIRLPASLCGQIDNDTNIGVFLHSLKYQHSSQLVEKLLTDPVYQEKILLLQNVLAATAGSVNFLDLDESVTIVLPLQVTVGSVSSISLVWWWEGG